MLAGLLRSAAADAEHARQGSLLAGILIILTILDLLATFGAVFVGGASALNPYALAFLVAFLGLYLINRRGGTRFTALALFALIMALIPIIGDDPGIGVGTAVLLPLTLVIVITLGGLLLSWKWVVLLALAVTGEMALMANLSSPTLILYRLANPADLFTTMLIAQAIVFAVGGLIAFYAYQMRQALGHLEQRNVELAAQSARERALLAQMQTTAIQVSQSARDINVAATQQAIGATQQATTITEVSGTIAELDQTAGQIAEAAAAVAREAEQALAAANHGQEAVRDSVLGMATIRARANENATRISALWRQSQQISEITDVIDEIAARTHILALNAAVESAGAGGEIGARFGTVASEIKKLAQRSAVATRDVRAVIEQVRTAISAAVLATEEGLKEAERGVLLAHGSGEANEDIIHAVARTAALAGTIRLATQQQRTASAQIVTTMQQMVGITSQAAAGSQQTLEAVGKLGQAAQGLATIPERAPVSVPAARGPSPPAHGTPRQAAADPVG